jgi:hypothetical protein
METCVPNITKKYSILQLFMPNPQLGTVRRLISLCFFFHSVNYPYIFFVGLF